MENITKIVEAALRHKPETRANNDLLWVEVCKALCIEKQLTSRDEIFYGVLNKDLPSSHSLAAALSVVRKKHPELKPTPEEMEAKEQARQQYIDNWRNA